MLIRQSSKLSTFSFSTKTLNTRLSSTLTAPGLSLWGLPQTRNTFFVILFNFFGQHFLDDIVFLYIRYLRLKKLKSLPIKVEKCPNKSWKVSRKKLKSLLSRPQWWWQCHKFNFCKFCYSFCLYVCPAIYLSIIYHLYI